VESIRRLRISTFVKIGGHHGVPEPRISSSLESGDGNSDAE
jgi:hypothetical protein